MHKAVFIDKDGTLIPDIPYNIDPAKITLETGVIEALRLLKSENYLLVVISNQSGLAKGFFTETQLTAAWNHIVRQLYSYRLSIDAFYYCPHDPTGVVQQFAVSCDCRKPMPGLLLTAARDLRISLPESWMIGDILNDVEAGNRAGCKTVLIDNGNETEWEMNDSRQPTFKASNLLEAASFIVQHEKYETTKSPVL